MRPKQFNPKRQRDRSAAGKRADALRRLRERWEETADEGEEWNPAEEPVITPMLQAVEGGIEHVIAALRASDEPDARDFLETYDGCSAADTKHLPLEYIAHAAGVGSLRLAELAQTALFLHGQMKVNMLLSSYLPSVVERSLKEAKTKKGLADREWMLKAGKVLPIPKGAQIGILVNQNNQESEEKEKPVADSPAWLSADQRLRQIHDMTDGQRRLPSPAAAPVHIGGMIDQMQTNVVEMAHVQPATRD